MRNRKLLSRRGQSGMVLVYSLLAMTAMLGFVSLAVDFGRYESCKTQLRRAAIAAARAGVANMGSSSLATTAAQNMAYANFVDASNISASNCTVTVQFLNWPSTTPLSAGNFASANAVQVTIRYSVPLLFGQILGNTSKDTSQSAVAERHVLSASPYVAAIGNPWLSGATTGTTASITDVDYNGPQVVAEHPWALDIAGPVGGHAASGQPYNSPVSVGFTVTPGSIITLISASGTGTNDNTSSDMFTADGNYGGGSPSYETTDDHAANGVSEHGISDLWTVKNGIQGVFLDNNVPDTEGTAPAVLDFTTQTARDYTELSPLVRQAFYVGDGQTSGGTQQSIVVPANATRLFLGTADGHEWSNNLGGFNTTFTQTTISLVQ